MHSDAGRRPYEESCRELQRLRFLAPGDVPPMPKARPRHDDPAPSGVSFFRCELADARLDRVSLPRCFFGRSSVRNVVFAESDLSESVLCWCDYESVEFSGWQLSGSDLRASSCVRTCFANAELRNADLRQSSFRECDFRGAQMQGARLTRTWKWWKWRGVLTREQRGQVDWQASDGAAPGGG